MNLESKEVTLNVHCGYETIKLFYFCGQLTQWSKCGKKNRMRYLAAVCLGSNTASEMCMNFVRTSHEVRTKCVRTSGNEVRTYCVRTSQEVRTNFTGSTYTLRTGNKKDVQRIQLSGYQSFQYSFICCG